MSADTSRVLWIGGYAPAEGITAVRLAPDGTVLARELAVAAASPSWLVAHPRLPVVYAALERSGLVQAFRRIGDLRLEPLGEPMPAGEAVCHLTVTADGALLIAACYGDGRLLSYPLGEEGAIGESVLAASSTASAEPSRSHASVELADGRVLSTDLGHDLLRVWHRDGAALVLDQELAAPAGSGPRHLARHPDGRVVVVTEYSGEALLLAEREGVWGIVSSSPLAAELDASAQAPSEVSLSADGATVLASIRGADAVAALTLTATGVVPLALRPSGTTWPRHHLLGEGVLLVAGQRADEVTVLALQAGTGIPDAVIARIPVPAPSALLWAPERRS